MRRAIVLASVVATASAPACGSPDPASEASPSTAYTESRFAEDYVTAQDSLRLYARIVGHGPDTVLIPASAWLARDVTRLAPGRTLVFYDPRGRGGSDYVRDSTHMGIEWELRDMEAVRSHFGIQEMSVMGWSYLGAVVALYAAEHPEHVRRVVQIGPMPPHSNLPEVTEQRGSPPDSSDLAYLARLRDEGLPEADPPAYCRAYMRIQMIRPMMGRPEAADEARIDPCMYWNEWPEQLFRGVAHLIPQEWDFTERARQVQAPVLTVHGAQDPNAPIEGGREWASLIPEARLVMLEGVGHAPWLEAPEEFFDEVDRFLGGGG